MPTFWRGPPLLAMITEGTYPPRCVVSFTTAATKIPLEQSFIRFPAIFPTIRSLWTEPTPLAHPEAPAYHTISLPVVRYMCFFPSSTQMPSKPCTSFVDWSRMHAVCQSMQPPVISHWSSRLCHNPVIASLQMPIHVARTARRVLTRTHARARGHARMVQGPILLSSQLLF